MKVGDTFINETFFSIEEARAYRDLLRAGKSTDKDQEKVLRAKAEKRRATRLTIDSLLKRYSEEVTPSKKGHKEEAYAIGRLRRIKTFSGLPVYLVDGDAIERLKRELKGCKLSDTTIRKYLMLVSHLFRIAITRRWCTDLQNPVKTVGATMWTDFKLFGDTDRQSAMRAAEASMVDYKRIRLAKERYRKLRAADTAKFHYEHKSWLHRKLAEPYDGKTVVVTHMAPSIKSLSDLYSDDPLSAAYASRLEDLAEKADIWIHGHMHESFDYLIGKCRVVCNPCGYITRSGETENSNFNSNMIVEVKP